MAHKEIKFFRVMARYEHEIYFKVLRRPTRRMGKLARAFIFWKYLDVEIENVNFGILLKEDSFLKP